MRVRRPPAGEREAWIALAAVPGIGDVTFGRLLHAYGNAIGALQAVAALPSASADRRLATQLGLRLRPGLASAIRAAGADPERLPRAIRALGGWLLTPLDPDYPALLQAIEEPPLVLYGRGQATALAGGRTVAVVGTRRPTAAGRDLSTRIAHRLVAAGATVVSGLAVGIDGAAHLAALEAGGLTVAVAGSGIDDPAPARHRRLAGRIEAQGAIISELAPGVRASQGTFPRRNRIISGLSLSTIVVEAPARSGALITARHALEQGRGLLVAPGRPLDARVAGSLALLRESPARPLVGLDEMVADLGFDMAPVGEPRASAPGLSAGAALDLLEPAQRAVALALTRGPHSNDELCRLTGLEAGEVAASLTLLQLRGWARVIGVTHLPAGPLLTGEGAARP